MKQAILVMALYFSGCLFLDAQVVEPKQPPKKPVLLVPATLSAKGGKLLIIDATKAKGEVLFEVDPLLDSITLDAKRLGIIAPKHDEAKSYWVTTISWDDRTKDKTVITVPGDKVAPPPPNPVDINKQILDRLDKIEDRLTKLEKTPVVVVPPAPADVFQSLVQAAYEKDGKPADKAAKLASLYRVSGPTVNDPSLTKRGEIVAKMHNAAQVVLEEPNKSVSTILLSVRRVLADDENQTLGKKDGILDATTRALIAAQFLKAQKALEGVK